ncbi:MAG: hypothetical protein VXW36_04325 [Candidatus Thermoplasmatota archaeon]|nr:hypothetical protein [Candidatus Thermoplasmatota archaeon]
MIGEAFWENPDEEKTLVQESKQEELVREQSQPSLNELEHHSNEESSSSEEPMHPALNAIKGIVTLVVLSLILWNSLGHAFLQESESTDYANEAMSWPITSVHIDSEIEVWSEEVSCGDETACYEDFFTADLILNCALLDDGNYTCGPEVENGTLIQTNIACKPNHSIFASGGNQYSISGPMPNPCIATYELWGWGDDGYEFPQEYFDDRYDDPWQVYDTECKWQSEPNDEPYWNCYFDNGEYDTWWYHCEFAVNESLWFCIDAFGPEASSEDNQNATERPDGSVQDVLSELSDDVLEVRYDPSDPTRVYIGDPDAAPSSSMAFIIGFMILGIAVLIGIIRVASMAAKQANKPE